MTNRPTTSRRRFLELALGASASVVLGSRVARADSAKLYVFVPADMQSRALQKLLSDSMANVDVLAFARFRDFETGLDDRPDALLTLQPILKAKGLPVTVVGSSGGSPTEPYVLMSAGKTVDPGTIESVGVVDILGRQGMKDLVTDLLGNTPQIERVTKVEDLLPLLQLASVDAVLLPSRFVGSLQSRSKLDLRVTPTRGGVGLPCVSVLTSQGKGIADSVRHLNQRVLQEMGVTRWD